MRRRLELVSARYRIDHPLGWSLACFGAGALAVVLGDVIAWRVTRG